MTTKPISSTLVALAVTLSASQFALAQDMTPFGSEHDVGYAKQIWDAMQEQRLAGPESIYSFPYEGTDPVDH